MSTLDSITKKLDIAPGINKNTTPLDAEGTYVSCDKVRFFYGKPEKIGGWQKELVQGEIHGVTRKAHTFVDLDENKYLGFGTNEKLYLFNGGVAYDITPVRLSVSTSNAIQTCAGSNLVRVCVNSQGAQEGDWFVFESGPTSPTDGVNFTSTYTINSAGVDSFTFLASNSAVAGLTSGGGGVNISFLLETGNEDNGNSFGWGAGTWGTPGVSVCAGWSEPRGGGLSTNLRLWSLDNYGENFLANPKGGKIYMWEASAGLATRARLMSSAAPSIVNHMLVAQEGRHVIAMGTHTVSGDYDPLLVRWSDSEDFNTWVASIVNQAGSFRLENGSMILGAVESRREIIVFTDESLYSMQRIGGDLVFAFRDMGTHNGLISPNAGIDVNGIVYWMGFNTFQYYDGVIHTLPCTVQEYLFNPLSEGSVNQSQKEKIYCATNREFNEIWWMYPSKNSLENDRYVIFNYLEQCWYVGTIQRTAWQDVDIFDRPYAFDASGNLFIHEQGKNDDTLGLTARLKTSFFDLEDGGNIMFMDRVIPDSTIEKDMNYTFNYKKYPQSTESFQKGPFVVTSTTSKIQPRIRGRQIQIIYSTSTQGGDFRIGTDRLSLKPDGMR